MKTLSLSKRDYDDLVYPAAAATTSPNLEELRSIGKILDALEAVGEPSREEAGRKAAYRLKTPHVELELEDAEAKILAKRLEEFARRTLQDWQGREILPLIDMLREK